MELAWNLHERVHFDLKLFNGRDENIATVSWKPIPSFDSIQGFFILLYSPQVNSPGNRILVSQYLEGSKHTSLSVNLGPHMPGVHFKATVVVHMKSGAVTEPSTCPEYYA